MKKPDIPQDEQARLRTLQSLSILDTPPEDRFDSLTRMAKRLFGVPIALVSLVDENRQWFKSCFGLNVSETSRDVSFCGHAILHDELLIIPDTLLDERFADNPLVVSDPKIRFYAGCPLRAPDGYKLGTLCIIDRQPRSFLVEDLEALKDLASMVERELAAVQMATLDELTRITNRRGFIMLGQHSLNLCAREHISASLIFMDLDKFKSINDTFGHAEGDRVLADFAEQMMKSVCRGSDIIARLGGDEFAMLLINSSLEQAENVVARLSQSIEKYNHQVSHDYSISFSHGIVEFNPDTHQSIYAMLSEGDSLMYGLKKSKG